MQSGSALNHIHKLYTFQSVLSSFQSFNVGAYPQTRSQEFLVPLILRTGDVDVEWKVGGVGRRLWRGEVEGIHGWGWWKTMKGEVEGEVLICRFSTQPVSTTGWGRWWRWGRHKLWQCQQRWKLEFGNHKWLQSNRMFQRPHHEIGLDTFGLALLNQLSRMHISYKKNSYST